MLGGVGALAALQRVPLPGWLGELRPLLGFLALVGPAYLLAARRGHDPYRAHGLAGRPRGLLPALGLSLGLLMAYALGWGWACGGWAAAPDRPWSETWAVLAWGFLLVALPEEWLFRGVLQPALERGDQARLTVLGAPVGRGLVLAALAFGVCHVFVPGPFTPAQALTALPGLWFGWLRARTDSVLVAALAHALANALQHRLPLGQLLAAVGP